MSGPSQRMKGIALVAVALVALAAAPGVGGAPRDDTDRLQQRLDAGGGTLFLPKLAHGACYRTRGLWLSHDDTRISSNGACIVALGPGPVRLRSTDGDPIASDAIFFVNHSDKLAPTPARVTISGLRLVVPDAARMFGIEIYGHDVTVRNVAVTGSPIDDLYVGGRANGDGYASHVLITHCRLENGGRNVLSAVSFIDLRIENSTLVNASNAYRGTPKEGGNPSAGIDIEPNSRGELALDLRIAHNVIAHNGGPGILLALKPSSGNALNASRLAIVGNRIFDNGRSDHAVHGGIVVFGGEADGKGTVLVVGNHVNRNRGAALAGWQMTQTADVRANDLRGNELGRYRNVRLKRR
jgi:hypothetical protein